MTDFENFIKVNGLRQVDVAKHLGVSRAFVTKLMKGERGIPNDKLARLQSNPEWDTSMFSSDSTGDRNRDAPQMEFSPAVLFKTQEKIVSLLGRVLEQQKSLLERMNEIMNGPAGDSQISLVDNHDGGITILNLHEDLQDIKKEVEALRYTVQK